MIFVCDRSMFFILLFSAVEKRETSHTCTHSNTRERVHWKYAFTAGVHVYSRETRTSSLTLELPSGRND